MPQPRYTQIDIEATPDYHVISRCVRRAFLCGQDRLTGKNFDHRKQWLVERMQELAGIFALDLCTYSVLSNHFHLILRIDGDRAQGWTDDQVAERYAKVFPHTVKQARGLPEPARAQRLARWRQRLGDLSWFMRCLNEAIARRANREDGCTGRFWEGRFRSQALLDEGALLACMTYVDLNPIRAGLADTLETSAFTSIRERLTGAATTLVPFAGEAAPGVRVDPLPVARRDYVDLLEWTVRSLRAARHDAVPAPISATLGQFDLDAGAFVDSVRDYGRSFFTMVGHVHRIEVESQRRGYRRCPGVRSARRMYRRVAA